MSTERINKFQPDRTLALRGFTGFGAAASLCETSPTGFKVYGVFRDQADFCVLVIYDADNLYEHYSVKYLPDFNLSGMVLSFNLSYRALQPLDSAKYSWIDWSQLDVVKTNGQPAQVRLWDYASLVSGSYSVARGTYKILAPGGCTIYDRLTLFVNNASFDFVAAGGEPAASVAQTLTNSINSYDWFTATNSSNAVSSIAVMASADATGLLTLKNARTGHVSVNGTAVTWLDGLKFSGIAVGSAIYLGGAAYTVAAVTSPTALVLSSSAGPSTRTLYLAEYGGVDGNAVQVYMLVRPGNAALTVDNSVLQFSGGNSDNVVWNISLDFTALGIDAIRQAWLTFAPQLASGSAYTDSQWSATFTNWQLKDPHAVKALQCAGPGSVRVGNGDAGATYPGTGWATLTANNYWRGFARATSKPGDQVKVSYKCAKTHDLYLGTSLQNNRGMVSVKLDARAATELDCFLNVGAEVVTRRLLAKSVPAGTHTVTLTLESKNHQAQGSWDTNSTGYYFLFDYIEAAIPSDVPDPPVTYKNVSAALDFDTDATYKVSPQRLLWHLKKLGFSGQLNEYLGVFWWNQRKRVTDPAAQNPWPSTTVTFSGNWTAGDTATITLGGVPLRKTLAQWDTPDSIAAHFVYYINVASVSMWAEKIGTGQLSIHTRTPNWGDTFGVSAISAAGKISTSGNLNQSSDGIWQIDASALSPINYPVAKWHADLFQALKTAGLLVTVSFSMELVNTPDDGTTANAWSARFYDGSAVQTATGFMNLSSTQCAPIANLTKYQQQVYTQMAGLQSAAGLTPWLQFGEFLWWYFSSMRAAVGYAAYTSPISIGLGAPHGFTSGDRVVVSGVRGMTSANGTWTITVTDASHFTLNGSSANGAWVTGSGTVSGGSMAYYDAVTTTAAKASLGRPLYRFTCQNDNPGVNSGTDTNFLAGRLKAHVDAIRQAVLAAYPKAKFEILYPNDVNNPNCLISSSNPYPQGGRLNAAANLPSAWRAKAGSGLDRFKVEALSWGATYRNLDLAAQAIRFAQTAPSAWAAADVAYLIPWFNGACPWTSEFSLATGWNLSLINFWAYDHLALMSWPVPFPTPARQSGFSG